MGDSGAVFYIKVAHLATLKQFRKFSCNTGYKNGHPWMAVGLLGAARQDVLLSGFFHCVLGLAHCLLSFAFFLLDHAFSTQFVIVCDFTDALLDVTDSFVRQALYLIGSAAHGITPDNNQMVFGHYVAVDLKRNGRVSIIFAQAFHRKRQVWLYVLQPTHENARHIQAATLNNRSRRKVMKLNKAQAIARRNTELGGAVLGVNNCHFTDLDRKRNIWWFDLPVGRIAVGQYEWIHLLMHNADTDQLLHLKVPTVFLREKLEGLVVRNAGKRKPEITLELSADKDSFLKDVRPAGAGVSFAQFAL